tara:strand:+ start:39 stop:497 length:459 start_codon:yes stop_codon:yes gene_type:complete
MQATGTLRDILPRSTPLKFDPESDGYFSEIGDKLNAERPLADDTKPPHIGPPQQTYANQTWEWHEDEKDWFKHSGSVTHRIDLLKDGLEKKVRAEYGNDVYLVLKGRKYHSYGKGVKGEQERGYKIVKGPGGYYYSIPDVGPPQQTDANQRQ